jgi:hypothetical protein
MEEFIAKHNLNVDIKNPQATRLIATKLRQLGYRPVRKLVKGERVKAYTNDADLADLKTKLADIKD